MPAATEKNEIRRSLFARLKTFSLGDRNRAAKKICSTLACLPLVKSSRLTAAYIALKSEPDLGRLLRAPRASDDSGGFAVSRVNEAGELDFYRFESIDELQPGEHGFLEPDPAKSELIEIAEIDVVLTPGVGFDPATFARLGRGKGHYDRFLARLHKARREAGQERSQVVGIGYQRQLVNIPTEPHDQPMDGLVTEDGFWQTPGTVGSNEI
jgi:5-formyltetrahydrofolate cyclo-ligase